MQELNTLTAKFPDNVCTNVVPEDTWLLLVPISGGSGAYNLLDGDPHLPGFQVTQTEEQREAEGLKQKQKATSNSQEGIASSVKERLKMITLEHPGFYVSESH